MHIDWHFYLFAQSFLTSIDFSNADNLDAVKAFTYYVNLAAADGETALTRASRLGREKIVELLIQSNADVNPVENDQYTPLNGAAANGKWSKHVLCGTILNLGDKSKLIQFQFSRR